MVVLAPLGFHSAPPAAAGYSCLSHRSAGGGRSQASCQSVPPPPPPPVPRPVGSCFTFLKAVTAARLKRLRAPRRFFLSADTDVSSSRAAPCRARSPSNLRAAPGARRSARPRCSPTTASAAGNGARPLLRSACTRPVKLAMESERRSWVMIRSMVMFLSWVMRRSHDGCRQERSVWTLSLSLSPHLHWWFSLFSILCIGTFWDLMCFLQLSLWPVSPVTLVTWLTSEL